MLIPYTHIGLALAVIPTWLLADDSTTQAVGEEQRNETKSEHMYTWEVPMELSFPFLLV